MTEVNELQVADLLREVRRVEIQSNRLVTGVMAGSYASVFRGSGIEVDEVREYPRIDRTPRDSFVSSRT